MSDQQAENYLYCRSIFITIALGWTEPENEPRRLTENEKEKIIDIRNTLARYILAIFTTGLGGPNRTDEFRGELKVELEMSEDELSQVVLSGIDFDSW